MKKFLFSNANVNAAREGKNAVRKCRAMCYRPLYKDEGVFENKDTGYRLDCYFKNSSYNNVTAHGVIRRNGKDVASVEFGFHKKHGFADAKVTPAIKLELNEFFKFIETVKAFISDCIMVLGDYNYRGLKAGASGSKKGGNTRFVLAEGAVEFEPGITDADKVKAAMPSDWGWVEDEETEKPAKVRVCHVEAWVRNGCFVHYKSGLVGWREGSICHRHISNN